MNMIIPSVLILILPLFWLCGEFKAASRWARIVLGLLALASVSFVTHELTVSSPVIESRAHAYGLNELEHLIRAGDTNNALAALMAYNHIASTGSTLQASLELRKTLESSTR